MNIHTVNALGFWAVLDGKGALAAVVYGTCEAAETLLGLTLPAGSVVLTPARSADGPFPFGNSTRGKA